MFLKTTKNIVPKSQTDDETTCKQVDQDEPIVTETIISTDSTTDLSNLGLHVIEDLNSKITEETTSKSIDGAPLAGDFSETFNQNVESVYFSKKTVIYRKSSKNLWTTQKR